MLPAPNMPPESKVRRARELLGDHLSQSPLEPHREIYPQRTWSGRLHEAPQGRGCLEDRVAIIQEVPSPERDRIALVA